MEYRGDALILSRTDGDGEVKRVAEALRQYYSLRYGEEGLRIIRIRKDGKICDCTLTNPRHFSRFLHLIHNNGAFDYPLTGNLPEISDHMNAVPVEGREPYGIRIELADRVYKPLLKEIVTWNDPIRARFDEWTRLELDERM